MHNEIGTWSMPHPNPGRHGGTSNSVVSSATLIGTFSKICRLSSSSSVCCLFVVFRFRLGSPLLLFFRVCQTHELGTYCRFQLTMDVALK